MNLKENILIFVLLLTAFFWGDKTITFNWHDIYYVISYSQIIVGTLILGLGIKIILKLIVIVKK